MPLQAKLNRDGMVLLKGSSSVLKEVAQTLGSIVPVRRGGPAVDYLSPTFRSDAAPNSLSSEHGLGAFPFHTDAASHRVPPRFVLLRYPSTQRSLTPTTFIDFQRLQLTPTEMKQLRREAWVVRGGVGRTFYATILSGGSTPLIRYDQGCMSPGPGTKNSGGGAITRALGRATPQSHYWSQDQILILDNRRFLHGRGPASGDSTRVLERVLVQAP
jgi:L-asparagine oxygenase